MINKSVLIQLLIFSFLFFSLNGCSGEKEEQAATSSETMMPQDNSDAAGTTGDTKEPGQTMQPSDTTPDVSPTASEQAETDKPKSESSEPQTSTQPANDSESSEHAEQLTLARKSGCLACHAVDKKVVGPAWRDVSKRYKGVADAKSRLIAKVSKGGKGNWTDVVGPAAMPPYSPRVSDENIAKLVEFVLSLEK